MNHQLKSINYHLFKGCDSHCQFCFAQFRDVRGQASFADSKHLLDMLRIAGPQKINFVGGEPTLHPQIVELIRYAKGLGYTTSIVTNGSRLDSVLDKCSEDLDWVGLSVDSTDERVQHELGRGKGDHIARSIRLADKCHELGVRLKLNTVVTSRTWREDMSELVMRLRPERWKVFQVLEIEGQNDGSVVPLLVSADQFQAFVQRNTKVSVAGVTLVPEDNDAMMDSYVMIDPAGRFFGNTDHVQTYSEPIIAVGPELALSQVGFLREKLVARLGEYDFQERSTEARANAVLSHQVIRRRFSSLTSQSPSRALRIVRSGTR